MGYGIMAYRVSLSRLKSRFGVSVSSKKSSIRKKCFPIGRRIDDMGSDDAPRLMQVVEELLAAKVEHPEYAYLYWYALKGFIEDLGAPMSNSAWYPAEADLFYELPEFKLYDIDAPMALPRPDDFPVVFVLRAEQNTQALVEKMHSNIKEPEQLQEVLNWLQSAQRYKQDLVLYYH